MFEMIVIPAQPSPYTGWEFIISLALACAAYWYYYQKQKKEEN
jgi:hypothetical protein